MDSAGTIVDERRLPNEDMDGYLNDHVPRETYAVLEATRNWPFMYDLLAKHVDRVELAHPKEVKMIASAAVKTDKVDASALAHLARLNFLPTAYAAPANVRDLRQAMRHREWLVGQRTQAKNRIHAVLAGYNLISPVSNLFGVKGRAYLVEVLANQIRLASQKVIADYLALIDLLDQKIIGLEDKVQLSEEQAHMVRLLMTMPGVGKIAATTVVGEVGDFSRFDSPKSLCNWSGLTPRVRKSDAIVRHGKISKQGSRYVRAVMVRAATVAARCSPRWAKVHDKLLRRCGKRGAKVAVARRMLTVFYYMIKRDQLYQENYHQGA